MQLSYTDHYIFQLIEESITNPKILELIEETDIDELKDILAEDDPVFKMDYEREKYQLLFEEDNNENQNNSTSINDLKKVKEELSRQKNLLIQASRYHKSNSVELERINNAIGKITRINSNIDKAIKNNRVSFIGFIQFIIQLLQIASLLIGLISLMFGIAYFKDWISLDTIKTIVSHIKFGGMGIGISILAFPILSYIQSIIQNALNKPKDSVSKETINNLITQGKNVIASTKSHLQSASSNARYFAK